MNTWAKVQPAVAETTQVCAFDRPGMGFSDEGPLPRDARATVADERAVLKAAGIKGPYVLVGHSERREYHHESDELLAKKVNAAYRHGLIPILCFGEGLEVREAGNQVQHSVDQMLAAMVDVTPEQAASIVLAYEPVWAIGTGRVATPADAQEVCGAARAALAEKYGAEIADGIRILYGGSVKSGNVAEITAQPDVDGALVGGASLDGTEFANLAANAVGMIS
jgi:triosephosphate isomerase